jgi:two-component system OmpR family response regulator
MSPVEPGTLVLVVDDDEAVRDGLADLLTMEGYLVRAIPSAAAAWTALAHGKKPAAIVLDLWLQGMSGGELVRRLRTSEHASIPVLILSGSHSKNGLEHDVDGFELKPVEGTTLVRAVDRLVRFGRRKGAMRASTVPQPAMERRAPPA